MPSDNDRCVNCGRDFADHDYVKDSINRYLCPEKQQEQGFPAVGCFHGGDPREFHPDVELTSESQFAAHRAACKLWDELEAKGETPTPEPCPSGFGPGSHTLRSPYGMGYTIRMIQTEFETLDDLDQIEDEE